MDILGERAIVKGMQWAEYEPPQGETLHQVALAGDLAANTAYYSLVGAGAPKSALSRGAAIGLVAGVGAVVLPGPMGLGTEPGSRTAATSLMTVALYLTGGLVAGAAIGMVPSWMANLPGIREPLTGWVLRWMDSNPWQFYCFAFIVTYQVAELFDPALKLLRFITFHRIG